MVVKKNGQTFNVDVISSEIRDIIRKKKHLCGGCQALVCRVNDRLASEVVKEGVRTRERYYVFDCDGYKAIDTDYFLRRNSLYERESQFDYEIKKYAGMPYRILHSSAKVLCR